MSTRATDPMRALCKGIESIFDSAVCAGIVGDRRHRRNKIGTYHLSREDCRPGTFSVIRPDDKVGQGPDDAATGFDIAMNRRDMIAATVRLEVVWTNRSDPRRKYLNAFNGWKGQGEAVRYDMVRQSKQQATPDHKSHLHGEVRRRYALSGTMVKATLSALRGETVAQYLASIGVKPPVKLTHGSVTPAAAPYPGRVLRSGNTRRDLAVQIWQRRMIARGWKSIGKADGIFASKTERVVKRFQRECKINDDGVIGPKTWPLPWTRPLGH